MDTVSNMLTMIKNASAVERPTISVPYTNLKYEVAKILVGKGFVEKVEKKSRKIQKSVKTQPCLEITLKYENGMPAMGGFKKISKPGQRMYLPYSKIRKVKQGYGIGIISTSKGLMTGSDARRKKIGGELMCEVW
jgi:small subunit ribosomal protein S8